MYRVILSMVIVALSIALIFELSALSQLIDGNVSENEFISGQFRYQLLLLGLASVVLAILYLLNRKVLMEFLSVGDISAPASPVVVFGIKENESWLSLGLSFSFFITLVTAVFMYFQLKDGSVDWAQLSPVLGWVVLFSLTNSFSEEVIFRLGLVAALYRVVPASKLMLISAAVFGLVHYSGMPSGVVGMVLAGILGWLLMKSVLETHGIFWAWFIHFLQDIIIFSGLVLLNAE